MYHILHLNYFLANSFLGLNHFFWALQIPIGICNVGEIAFPNFDFVVSPGHGLPPGCCGKLLINSHNKHFHRCHIYLVILQAIKKSLVSNHCVNIYIYILEFSSFYR
jgi:hypothetical protein